MDGKAKAERQGCKDTARVIGFVVPLIVLLWIVHMGYKLTNESMDIETGDSEGSYISLVFGVVTVVVGLIYFIVGLTIVAELAQDLLAWLDKEDTSIISNQEKEQKTICQIFIQVTATMVSMSMLLWAIYYGYKLVAETQRVVIYSRLAFLIGVITMAFGFIYFIIGIALVADSALHLSGNPPAELYQAVGGRRRLEHTSYLETPAILIKSSRHTRNAFEKNACPWHILSDFKSANKSWLLDDNTAILNWITAAGQKPG